jgi:hypothetical protein
MIDIVITKLYRTLLHSFMTRHFMRKQLIKILYRVSFLFSLCCMRQLVKIFYRDSFLFSGVSQTFIYSNYVFSVFHISATLISQIQSGQLK